MKAAGGRPSVALASYPWAWLAVSALIGVPALAWHDQLAWTLSVSQAGWLEPALWANVWRSTWVHPHVQHGLLNLAACVLLMAWGWVARPPAQAAMAWALAWPLTHLALLADPRLSYYFGMSGALHAGVAVMGVHLVRHGQRWAWALLAGLLLKCLLENPELKATLAHPVLDMQTAPLAHLLGSLIGIVSGWLCVPWQSRS